MKNLDFSELGIRMPEPSELSNEQLLDMPAVSPLQHAVNMLEKKVKEYETEELNIPEVLASRLRRARWDLARAQERDRRQALRPENCWCLGLGGRGEVPVTFLGDVLPDKTDRRPRIAALDSGGQFIMGFRWYCECDVGMSRLAVARAAREKAEQDYRARRLEEQWGALGIPRLFAGLTLETWAETAPENAQVAAKLAGWSEAMVRDRPAWLVLSGQNGRGKTGVAAALAQRLLAEGRTVLFRDCVTLFDQLRGAIASGTLSELQASLLDVDVLVLDDLGAGREEQSDFERDQFFRVINTRHDNLLRTIITTNLTSDEVKAYAGERARQRILEMTGTAWAIKLNGPNLRVGP